MRRIVERSFSKNALDWVANLPDDRYRLLLADVSGHYLWRLVILNDGQFNRQIRRIMRQEHLSAAQLDYILDKRYREMLAKKGMSV